MIITTDDIDQSNVYNEHLKIERREDFGYARPDDAAIVCARGDHRSESLVGSSVDEVMAETDKTEQEFLDDKVRRGHWGVYEHPHTTFFVENLSYYGHLYLTRHRHMSFDVQSQRYTDAHASPVITPTSKAFPDVPDAEPLPESWETAVEASKEAYEDALEAGYGKQHARSVLPQGLAIHLSFTTNIRSAFHWLDLRGNAKAHPEAQQFAVMMERLLDNWAPKSMKAYREHSNSNALRAP